MNVAALYHPQTERAFLRSLVGDASKPGLARLLGWAAWHDRATNAPRCCPHCGGPLTFGGNAAGWPDLFLLRDDTLIVAELKSERGKLSVAQRDWLQAFAKIRRVIVAVWRPSDVPVIEKALRP